MLTVYLSTPSWLPHDARVVSWPLPKRRLSRCVSPLKLKLLTSAIFPLLHDAEMHVSDAFDNVVVFTELQWIGTAEENPEETPLPWPEGMLREVRALLKSSGPAAFCLFSSHRIFLAVALIGEMHTPFPIAALISSEMHMPSSQSLSFPLLVVYPRFALYVLIFALSPFARAQKGSGDIRDAFAKADDIASVRYLPYIVPCSSYSSPAEMSFGRSSP